MDAMQFRLDVIANNLANAQTTAFKRSRVNFEDLYYQYFKIPGMIDFQGRPTSVGLDVGTGVRVQSTPIDTTQGSLLNTGGNSSIWRSSATGSFRSMTEASFSTLAPGISR